MQKNTVMFVVFSTLFLMGWYMLFQPKPIPQQPNQINTSAASAISDKKEVPQTKVAELIQKESNKNSFQAVEPAEIEEQDIIIETDRYKAVFTNKGAGIKNWFIKEKNGALVDLVLSGASPVMTNFPGSVYKIAESSKNKIVFVYTSKENWKITKTFDLSSEYLHKADFKLEKLSDDAKLPAIDTIWGPGIGTDNKELKENESVTRILGYTSAMPAKLEKLKSQNNEPQLFKWVAIDNRYFLAAFIPANSLNFSNFEVSRQDKKHSPALILSANVNQNENIQSFSMQFFIGPKSYSHLKTFNIGLEKTVDFGFFGWLGKIAMTVLFFFFGLTSNYGWAIIILTIIIQILVLPLTLKSYRAMAGMKKIQPFIKDLQTKYKNDPKRLQVEMMNLYKSQKVNPLGGCLPLLLQLPIFWALFTTLRNAYELRFAEWIFWVKDLSASDSLMQIAGFNLNLLPLIMGVGMFFQQKMTSATSDPMQRKLMYIMPIVFTFMFWGFPSGLVLYWLTNSIVSMIVQFFVLKQDKNKSGAK
ncbi:membrane protein insertase YidC [Elusimicrobiota bacterium]